jgi:LysM repeat protein
MSNPKTSWKMAALACLLTGCTISYSPPANGTPATTQSHSSISPAEATMDAIRAAFFTQTAIAKGEGGGATATPQITNTPAFATVAATDTTPVATVSGASPTAAQAITTLAATRIIVPTATPGIPASYTIHEGETAWCLARRFNVDPYDLLSLNGLTENSLIQPDDVLKLPSTGKTFPGDRALTPHTSGMLFTVQAPYNTIYAIACHFGDVDPNAIIAANSLSAPYTLQSGQKITIP